MIAVEERKKLRRAIEDEVSAIELEGVVKWFGTKQVLKEISLQIAQGELLAIVGRSGCGKSTLLRLLIGLESASNGSIQIGGEPLKGSNREARLMFQDAALLPWETVIDNVALGAIRNRDRREVADEALRMVGLEQRAKDWPSILSGGQRQRVALARALASKASILLLDEPLGALDALTKLEMQNLIEQIWLRERFTAVLVTHDVEEAVALADRVLVMEEGRVIAEIRPNLPRPRSRSSQEFIEVRDKLLSWVMKDYNLRR